MCTIKILDMTRICDSFKIGVLNVQPHYVRFFGYCAMSAFQICFNPEAVMLRTIWILTELHNSNFYYGAYYVQ